MNLMCIFLRSERLVDVKSSVSKKVVFSSKQKCPSEKRGLKSSTPIERTCGVFENVAIMTFVHKGHSCDVYEKTSQT